MYQCRLTYASGEKAIDHIKCKKATTVGDSSPAIQQDARNTSERNECVERTEVMISEVSWYQAADHSDAVDDE